MSVESFWGSVAANQNNLQAAESDGDTETK